MSLSSLVKLIKNCKQHYQFTSWVASLSRRMSSSATTSSAPPETSNRARSGRGKADRNDKENPQQPNRARRGRQENRPKPPPPTPRTCSCFGCFHHLYQAEKYKVHLLPGCVCPKLERRIGPTTKTTTTCHDKDQEGLMVLPEGRVQRQLSQVHPQDYVFTWRPTAAAMGKKTKESDPKETTTNILQWENHLRSQIWDCRDTWCAESNSHQYDLSNSTKISCAVCLLQDYSNGFVCVQSHQAERVAWARDAALARRQQKMEQKKLLHSDHAHFICVLPRASLAAWQTAQTRQQKALATQAILAEFKAQHIGSHQTDDAKHEIDLGNHIATLLRLTSHKNNNSRNNNHQPDEKVDSMFWMVLVYDKSRKSNDSYHNKNHNTLQEWELDLPGGKRHLGEDSWQGAVREVEEESSLELTTDRDDTSFWLQQVGSEIQTRAARNSKYASDGSVYFFLEPQHEPPTPFLSSTLLTAATKAEQSLVERTAALSIA